MDSTQLAVNEGTEVVASGPAPAVLNQQEVPVTTAPEISTIPAVEGAFVIPSALTILAKQFLSPVFGNMTMDHLKATMSFNELVTALRKNMHIMKMRDMMELVHLHCLLALMNESINVLAAPAPTAGTVHAQRINVRVIMAAYMIVLWPSHVFEKEEELETKLIHDSKEMLTAFEKIVALLADGKGFIDMPPTLVLSFPDKVRIYISSFSAWKTPDEARLAERITNALNALHQAKAHLEETASDAVKVIAKITLIDEQITRLRIKLGQIAGPAAVEAYSNSRQGAESTAPTNRDAFKIFCSSFLSKRCNIPSHQQLAHEITLDPSFGFEDDGSMPGIPCEHQLYEDTFWDNLATEYDRGCFSKVYLIIADIKLSLLSSLQDTVDNAALKININEKLDITGDQPFYNWSFCQMLVHSIYEFIMLAQDIKRNQETLEKWVKLQKQIRREEECEKGCLFSTCLQFFFTCTVTMHIDAANSRLRLLAPVVVENYVDYQRLKFNAQLTEGEFTLEHTAAWLKPVLEDLKLKQLSQLTIGDGDKQLLRKIHRIALVNHIKDPPATTPEVLLLDKHRLQQYSAEFKRLVTCGTIMRIVSNCTTPKLLVVDSASTCVAMLGSISDIILAHSPEKEEDIQQLYNCIMHTQISSATDFDADTMLQLLGVCFEADCDERVTITKRIELYLKDFNPNEADVPIHSIFSIAEPITNLTRKMEKMANLNLLVHTPIFNDIIKSVAKDSFGIAANTTSNVTTNVTTDATTNATNPDAPSGWHPPLVYPTTTEPNPAEPNPPEAESDMA